MADTNAAPAQVECKCGIPNCQGHKIVDGKAIIERHPHLTKSEESHGREK